MVRAAPERWTDREYARLLRMPQPSDHKGTRGRVLLVGGAPGLTGAVCLAARAALRSGAGYVTVAVPTPLMTIVEMKLTVPVKIGLSADGSGSLEQCAVDEVLQAAARADAVVLGPGFGRSPETVRAVRDLVTLLDLPLVLDADALFALGDDLEIVRARTAPTILTPHAGEAGRLLGLTREEVEADREGAARALAVGSSVALLKGSGTLICAGGRIVRNPVGGPELATLGTGDVLSGIIGSLLAQGTPSLGAAALGAYLHGAAGAAAAARLTSVCCTAEDVVAYLPEACRPLIEGGAQLAMEVRPMTELMARDIMTPDPITVSLDTTVTEAAHLMSVKRVGALPVVDTDGNLVGLVSEGDLIMQDVKVHFPTYLSLLGGYIFAPGAADRFESELRKAVGATVQDVMTAEPITVSPGALVTDVATLIIERDIARVPVVDGDKLVGIVSKSDIVRTLAG